ncbi:hypothetical protein ACTFIR_011911 [Dictyostelium discoideum]
MSTTVNNNYASSSSTSASNNAESFDLRMKSMEDQINNLSLAFTRFMKEPIFSSNTNSRGQGTHQQPIIQDGRNQESTIDGKTRFLHGKTRYQESLPPRITPRIFTMLLRPVLRMLRDIKVSVIAYLDDLLIVGSTKEECLSNLKKTMDLLVKLGFKLNLEKSVLEPTQSIANRFGINEASCSQRKEEKCHKGNKKLFKTRLCRCHSQERKQDNQDLVIPVVNNSIEHVIKSSRNACAVNGVSSTMSETEQLQAEDSNRQHNHSLNVSSSSYSRFRNFCPSNSLNPANITLVVFMDYLTHLFKHKPPLAFSTINGHRSMLNQLLLLKNQTDIVNDPFITRIMTGIHKLRPSSAKYQEIWDANQVFKYLSTIKVIPKYTYTALLKKTLVLCPVINAKEQREGVLSILELTSLDDTNSASKGRRKPHSGDSVFIQNEGKPLDVKEINIIVLSTLSSSGIDISKFKSHSTRSAMASLLLSNNVPFHVVKKMGRWKSNDTVDTFYDKRIIGEKSGGFLNTVVQIS